MYDKTALVSWDFILVLSKAYCKYLKTKESQFLFRYPSCFANSRNNDLRGYQAKRSFWLGFRNPKSKRNEVEEFWTICVFVLVACCCDDNFKFDDNVMSNRENYKLYIYIYNKRSVLRRQSRDRNTNRNTKRSVYCQYG